jgi:hypothetical protein
MQLVATASGIDLVLPLHDGPPPTDFDAHIEIMELGHALRIMPYDLPGAVPYLFARNVDNLTLSSAALRVGLVWSAGDFAPHRSMQARSFSPLSMISNIQLYSFQRGPARVQARDIPALDISTPAIDDLVAALRAVDVIICIDTFVAHLAGALGLPVWLLLHAECDWRWMSELRRTVWYPTMRLFRQRTAGDWHSVIEDVAAELAKLAEGRRNADSIVRQEQTKQFDVRPS